MIQDAGAVKSHNVVADGGGVPHNDGAVDTIVNSTAAELGAVTGDSLSAALPSSPCWRAPRQGRALDNQRGWFRNWRRFRAWRQHELLC